MPPLPTSELHELPEDATIAVPVPAEGLTLYRLLEHEAPSERDFEPNLSRNQAKLRGVPELFRGSISHWLEHGQAVGARERSVCFVRRLELPPRGLVRVAMTEEMGRGHVDVWAPAGAPPGGRRGSLRAAACLDCEHERVHRPGEHPC